jgi:hypothetical protein
VVPVIELCLYEKVVVSIFVYLLFKAVYLLGAGLLVCQVIYEVGLVLAEFFDKGGLTNPPAPVDDYKSGPVFSVFFFQVVYGI